MAIAWATISTILGNSLTLFSITAAILALFVLAGIFKKKTPESAMKNMLIVVFSFLALTYVLYAIGNIWFSVTRAEASFPDLFFVGGTFTMIFSFFYLSWYVYRQHEKTSNIGPFAVAAITLVFALVILFVLANYIIDVSAEPSLLHLILDYFYPLSDAPLIVSAVTAYLFFRRIGTIGRPIYLIAAGNIASFIADIIVTYFVGVTYGALNAVADILFLTQYLLGIIAMILLIKTLYQSLSKNKV